MALSAAAGSVSATTLTAATLVDRYGPLHLGLLYLPEFAGAVITAVLFGGNKIGILWSDQRGQKLSFRWRWENDAPNVWQPTETIRSGFGCVDDHINMKADSQGRIYVVAKDFFDGVYVARRDANGAWALTTGASGLDCGTPKLLFDDLNAEVPTLAKLMSEGMYGDLASITPPITVPAWACGMTGTTPGQLGLYGFRNRKDTTYEGLSIAHSGSIKTPAVWDALGAEGKRSVLIGVPPSFPPPSEFPGWRVGCFLTPPSAEKWAFPQELEVEIEE